MKQYTIKPLEWEAYNLISIAAVNCSIDLRIHKEGHLYCVYSNPSTAGPNGFISLDHAKDRAQEIWENYLKQYLEQAPLYKCDLEDHNLSVILQGKCEVCKLSDYRKP